MWGSSVRGFFLCVFVRVRVRGKEWDGETGVEGMGKEGMGKEGIRKEGMGKEGMGKERDELEGERGRGKSEGGT